MRTGLALFCSALCISLPAGRTLVAAPAAQQAVNPLASAMVDFKKRMDAYLELRKAVTKKYPEVKETGNPAKIHEREVVVAEDQLRMPRRDGRIVEEEGIVETSGPVAGECNGSLRRLDRHDLGQQARCACAADSSDPGTEHPGLKRILGELCGGHRITSAGDRPDPTQGWCRPREPHGQ